MSQRTLEQYLDQIDLTSLGGETRLIEGNTPVLLTDPGQALVVIEGHVDVFAVRLEDDHPSGQRYSLFRTTAGEALFGMSKPAGSDASDLVLMAVGVAGTRILDFKAPDNFNQLEPQHLAAMLDRFVGGLSMAFPRARPDGSAFVMEPGQEASDLYRDMPVFSATRRPLWISTHSDQVIHLYGDPDLSATTLPVSSSVWVTAPNTTGATAVQALDLVENGNWHTILTSYLEVYSLLLGRATETIERQVAERQEASRHISQSAVDAATLNMAATVRHDFSGAPRLPVSMDPLHAAFLDVARHLGVDNTETAKRLKESHNANAIDALALTYRLRVRTVILQDDWWKSDVGPLIGYVGEDRRPVSLLPRPGGGYDMCDPDSGSHQQLKRKMAETLLGEAHMLYRPLPENCHKIADMIGIVVASIRKDMRRIVGMGLCVGLIAAFTPVMTGALVDKVLPRADIEQHVQIILALIVAAVGGTCFEVVKAVALLRIEGRADLTLQAALFDRLLRLPVAFFRKYTAGDLADRVLGIQTIRQTLSGTTVQSLLGVTFSLFSLLLLFYYNWKLALIACSLVAGAILMTIWLGMKQVVEERARIAHQGIAEGFVIQFLTGMGKLRVAAAESRAFARWAGYFTQQKRRFVRAQFFANQQDIFQAVFPVVATGVIFIMASVFLEDEATQMQLQALVSSDEKEDVTAMSTGDFIAFNTAFGQFLAAMTTLATALTKSLSVFPLFDRMRPVVEGKPEVTDTHKAAETLLGNIEINQVDFRYNADAPLILNNLSLAIEANEFVAIVGPSGSGKSTLIRLLLGFERCETGDVLYDGTPIDSLDMTSVRQQVRVVMQHSQLTTGSVFTNIVGNSTLTQDDAWYAARLAGLDKEIEALPMGMHTVLMEGVNTFSGGQRQRLMIARALVHRPRILLMDEPTSALDNNSQDIVMNSLAHLNATRIIIAHRLSTVRAADRILVVDGGRLVEQGTYDELMENGGPFADLAKRQLV